MLEAIKELGLLTGGRPLYDEISADKVIVLNFDEEGNFAGTDLEKFDSKKVGLYLYKKAKGSNPPTLTPTIPVGVRDLKNKKEEKREKATDKLINNLRKSIKGVKEAANNQNINISIDGEIRSEIKNKILELSESLSNKERVILTIKINGKYIGQIQEFIEALKNLVSQEGKDSKGKALCSVCLQEKEVSGDISPFKFYTIDKPGYIVGGFRKEEAYKNFPLCYECKELIEAGRSFIEKNLLFGFVGGLKYYLIPEFIYGIKEIVEEILEILKNKEYRKHVLSKREKNNLTADEEEILELLSEENDVLLLNFLFLEKTQGAERILLFIQDIYPSRLKELFKAKKFIEKLLGDGERPYSFTYINIYKFFSKTDSSKSNPDLIKYFLEIVEKTFRCAPVDLNLVRKFLLNRIRRELQEEGNYSFVIRDAFGVFLFIIFTTGEETMSEPRSENLKAFVESLPTLDTDLKRGLFLMGALAERLLRVQYSQRESKPFLKKLRSLRMRQSDLMELLPEIRAKLEEYDGFRKGEATLFETASEYLAKTQPNWNLSIEEMNFYFALGMGMFNRIAGFIYKGGDHEEQA